MRNFLTIDGMNDGLHCSPSCTISEYRLSSGEIDQRVNFSTMKNIKFENRPSISNEIISNDSILDELLTLNIDKATVEDVNPDSNIDL